MKEHGKQSHNHVENIKASSKKVEEVSMSREYIGFENEQIKNTYLDFGGAKATPAVVGLRILKSKKLTLVCLKFDENFELANVKQPRVSSPQINQTGAKLPS